MESKRPFARVAGWAALWLAAGALVLFIIPLVTKSLQTAMPAAFAMTMVTVCALGVFVCVLGALICGIVAVCGMRTHGRKGILAPAASGLTVAALMLIPIVIGMATGFERHSRLVKAREVTPAPAVQTNSLTAPVPPAPAR